MNLLRRITVAKVAAAVATIALACGFATVPASPASAVATKFQCIPGSQGFGYSYGNSAPSLMSGVLYLPSSGTKTKLYIGTGKINWANLTSQLDASGDSWLFSLKWIEPLIMGYESTNPVFPDRDKWLRRAQAILLDFNAAYPDQRVMPAWNGWIAALRGETVACLSRHVAMNSAVIGILVKHAEFQTVRANYLGGWNQGLEQDVALLAAGCVLNRQDWVDLANRRASVTLDTNINPDGSMNEQAPGYGVWAFSRWMVYANVSRQCSNDGMPQLYSRLRLALQYLNDSIGTDGKLIPLGDTAHAAPGYSLSNSSAVLNFTPSQGTLVGPTNATISEYRDGGVVYARTNYNQGVRDQFVSMRFGPMRYAHGHFDHTSVTWWGDGHPVLVDGGFSGYGTTGMPGWLRTAEAHNVLTYPGIPYRTYASSVITRSNLTDRAWFYEIRDQSISATTGADAGGAYQGLTRQRGILTVPDARVMVALDQVDKSQLRWMYKDQAKTSVRWWHLDRSFTAVATSRSTVTATSAAGQVTLVNVAFPEAPLTAGATRVVRGAKAPLQGWMATGLGKVYAAPAVGMTSTGDRMLSVIVDSAVGTVVKTRLTPEGAGWLLQIDNGANVTVVQIDADGAMSVV